MNIFFRTILLLFLSLFSPWALALDESPSLHELKSRWRTTANAPVTIAFTKGQPAVIAMVYTGCAHACPLTIRKLQEIEKGFLEKGIKDVRFVLASFDVKRDRPKRLKAYQSEMGLDFERWSFLSADSEKDARELAVTLGISYKKIGKGDYSHSNIITLIDEAGRVIASLDNLNTPPESMINKYLESRANVANK